MKLKLLILTILSIISFTLPIGIYATAPLSVRLGQPKSPTNQNTIKLTFVALEVGGTSNIAVSCYKKSPSDGSYVKFQDISLIPGGNTDYCDVTSSILNTSGTYSFYVKANGQDSNIVSVDFNTSGPSTPHSYSKEKINDCDYKIKFKTANDGRTEKVELFRSDTNSISLDSSSRVASPAIAPNTEGEIINSTPVCGKEYFYVLRAVDNYGNASGTTGDSFTTTTSSTSTTSTTVSSEPGTAETGGALLASSSQVAEETSSTTTEEESQEEVSPTQAEETINVDPGSAEVLGTETSKKFDLRWLLLVLAVIGGYFFFRSKKRAQ